MKRNGNRIKILVSPGFNLVELCITLLIAGIFMAGILPGLERLVAVPGLEVAADRLAGDIRELQQRAASEDSAQYFILFNQFGRCYYIRKRDNPEPVTLATVKLPAGVELEHTNFQYSELHISAQGLPTQGGTVTLRRRGTNRFKYVIVASITGRVRVSTLPPESWESPPPWK